MLLDMTEIGQLTDAIKKCRTWIKAKARDNFLVLGDFIPVEQIPDPHKVELEFKLNGVTK